MIQHITNRNFVRSSANVRLVNMCLAAGMGLALLPSGATAQTAPPATTPPATTPMAEAPLQYLMKRGDTLIDLARTYLRQSSDYRQLQRDNTIANPRRIPTGRTIDIDPALLRTRSDPARLESFRGDVRILRASQSVSLEQGMTLLEGDVVATGAGAFARLNFSDGSHTVVPSNSRLRLDRLRRYVINDAADHRLVIDQGRAEIRVSPRQRPGTFRVTTPTAISAVRGTDFRVAYDATSGISATGVLGGSVAVAGTGNDSGYLFEPGRGAVIRQGQDGVTAVSLLSAPVMGDASVLQTAKTLRFDVSAPDGTAITRGWIGADAGLLDPVTEIEAPAGQPLNLTDLPEGQWFLRLSAVSADSMEGRVRTFNFIRALNTVEGLEQSMDVLDQVRTYRFAWRAEGEGEASFRFQLSRSDGEGVTEGQPLIDTPGLGDSHFTLTDLPAGTYSWRVEGTRYRFGHRLTVWSQPEILTISR